MTRIRWDTYEKLAEIAQRERRSIPVQLSIIIEDWLRARNAPAPLGGEPAVALGDTSAVSQGGQAGGTP